MKHSFSEHPTFKYSLKWCLGRVHEFTKYHPRATEAVNARWCITDEMLATWLVWYPQRWRNYKKLVKRLTTLIHHLEYRNECDGLHICEAIENILLEMGLKPYQDV